MNQQQTVAMWVGIAVAAAMFLFPPWLSGTEGSSAGAGFAPLWNRPPWRPAGTRVDVALLLAEWALVAVITGAAIVTLKGKGAREALRRFFGADWPNGPPSAH